MQDRPTYDELLTRIGELEKRDITLKDLPLAALQRKLEHEWMPSGAVLLRPRSVPNEALAEPPLRYQFPNGNNILDIPVDNSVAAGLLVVDFEYKLSAPAAEMYLRPNGDANTIYGAEHFTSSTIGPAGIAQYIQIPANAGWRVAPGAGSTGYASILGTMTLQTRPTDRRVGMTHAVITNTVGSGNFYTYGWETVCVWDTNIGANTPLTLMRLVCSSGNFLGGTAIVRKTLK